MFLEREGRRRSPGGVFFALSRDQLTDEQFQSVFQQAQASPGRQTSLAQAPRAQKRLARNASPRPLRGRHPLPSTVAPRARCHDRPRQTRADPQDRPAPGRGPHRQERLEDVHHPLRYQGGRRQDAAQDVQQAERGRREMALLGRQRRRSHGPPDRQGLRAARTQRPGLRTQGQARQPDVNHPRPEGLIITQNN
jgi:hypothetical protein